MPGSQHQPCVCDIHHRVRLFISVWLQHRRTQPTSKGIATVKITIGYYNCSRVYFFLFRALSTNTNLDKHRLSWRDTHGKLWYIGTAAPRVIFADYVTQPSRSPCQKNVVTAVNIFSIGYFQVGGSMWENYWVWEKDITLPLSRLHPPKKNSFPKTDSTTRKRRLYAF